MPKVELIYEPSCPNLGAARAELSQAFARLKLRARWTEWDVLDPQTPERVRRFGSPTVLVDGRDVSGENAEAAGASCRIYREAGGTRGAPSADTILSAFAPRPWRSSFVMLPALGTSLLPNVACPACWPAYAGALTSMGLGVLMDSTFLLPLTIAFLSIALGALAFRARSRRGFGPLVLGVLAAALVLLGKFSLDNDASIVLGVAFLIAASLWNNWPRRAEKPCLTCETN